MPSTETRRRGRGYYVGAGIFMILLSVGGFGPSILDQSARIAPLTPMVIAHGVVAAAWILLFVLQATLVATGRTAVHRRVGTIGLLLAAVLIAMGSLALTEFARRGYDLSGDVVRLFAAPGVTPRSAMELAPVRLAAFGILIQFGVLVIVGIWCRHRPEAHKRLMLLALLSLASAPVIAFAGVTANHWPALRGPAIVAQAIIPTALMFASAIFDAMSKRRLHLVSWLVPILALAWKGLAIVVSRSVWWRDIAAWMIR